MRWTRSWVVRYGVAVSAVGLVLLVKLLLDPLIEQESPFLLFFAAVMVSALFGGLGPGLLATALAALAADYFFLSPVRVLWIEDFSQGFRLFLFVFEGLAISVLCAVLAASRRRAGESLESLRQSEERFRLLAEDIDFIPWEADLSTRRFTYVGPQAVDILGHPLADWYEDGFWAGHLHPEDRERVVSFLANFSGQQRRYELEYRMTKPDGSSVWLADIARVSGSEAGRLRGVMIDITGRKEAEEEVRRLNRELERRVQQRTAQLEAVNRELESFSYSVSHDLRAPLRHIGGFARLLRKRVSSSLDETSLRYLDVISDAVQQAGGLIDDLLAFSRMGRAEMRHTTVDMNHLVRDTLDGLQLEVDGRDIIWKIGDLPEVSGDPSMLRLVVRNLLSNAVKYTRPRDEAQIEVGSQGSDDETVFFVRDNGVGFDMKYQDKLFGVFQRLHRAEEFEGTGIGLANVRRIVQRHGGRAWAEGAPDAGAAFYFSLPTEIQESSDEEFR